MSESLKPRRGGLQEGDVPALAQPIYEDDQAQKKFPTLVEFLTREWWEPNKPRQKGTLVVFAEDGLFKAAVSDKDGEYVAFVSKKTLMGLLEAIEKGLILDSLDWRLTAAGRQRKRK